MMPRRLLTLTLCLLLSACSLLTGAPSQNAAQNPPAIQGEPATPTPVMPPELKGDLEIQQLMLTSHTRWKRLHAIYTVRQYPTTGIVAEPDQQNVQLWIELPGKFKVVVAAPKGGPQTSSISDGQNIIDLSGMQGPLPPSVLEPFSAPNSPSDSVSPYPLAGFMGTPVSDLVFPAGLAQRGGEYRQTGIEVVAGREASVVEWSREPGTLIDRFWVDRQTGIILHQQNYGKQNNTSPVNEYLCTYIEIDGEIAAETFNLADVPTPAPSSQPPLPGTAIVTVRTQTGILNVRSAPDTTSKIITTLNAGQAAVVLGKNTSGDWWQIEVQGGVGWVFGELVDFKGDVESVPVVR